MNNLKFEKISIDQGLSQSTVYSITQDNLGFLWLATEEGLNRYDGYNFKIYKKDLQNKNSIYQNWLKVVYKDSVGNIWIGTLNGRLVKYNAEQDSFTNLTFDENFKCESTSIIEDSEGCLWLGSFNGGLRNYEVSKNEFRECWAKSFIKSKNVYCVFIDSENIIWVGTWDHGLYLFEKDSQKNITDEFYQMNDNTLSGQKRIRTFFEDSKKNVWIGTKNGFYVYHRTKKNHPYISDEIKEMFSNITVTSICEDQNSTIWIGTKANGLFRINNKNKVVNFRSDNKDLSSLSNDTIHCLFVDKSNVLWIGTSGGGLSKLNCGKTKFQILNSSKKDNKEIPLNSVLYNYIDSEKFHWVGTFNNGLHILENNELLDTSNYKLISETFYKDSISRIIEDEQSNIWISNVSKFGLLKYFRSSNTFKIIKLPGNHGINSICIHKNYLWIASRDSGLLKYDIVYDKYVNISDKKNYLDVMKNDMIFCLYVEEPNTLWIGTVNEGLFSYNIDENIIWNYKFDENNELSLSDNFILCIEQDNFRNLFVGTNNGLNILNREQNIFERYTIKNGLPNNMIKGISEDNENNLWISTNKGISKFNRKKRTFRNFEINDGLQSNEFNDGAYFKDKDGTIYFGGINGISYFKPEEITDNPYIPNVVLTDFEIFNLSVIGSLENPFLKKNITYADEINLSYRESVFSFRFAALIFNNPQKNQYAYKMEGFDKDWTYCGPRKRVTYTNLNPGDYTFRVKGSNNDGVWNEEGTSIKIHISPPYWKTVWFKGLSLLSLVGAVGLAYRQRLEKLEKEGKAQEEFSRKLIEVQESEKKRIADDLHDTIAHEILISKQKAMMALKHKDDKDRMEKTLEEISELTSATITEVRNIAYGLHPHQLDRLGFTKTIKSIINEVSRSTSIKCVFETDNVDELLPKESEINLFRVIQETITNIIKHSQATEVILKVSKQEDHILILLIDNGKGMNLKGKEFINAKSGFGISTIAERLKIMDGEVSIDSEINKGTTLRFKIPLKK